MATFNATVQLEEPAGSFEARLQAKLTQLPREYKVQSGASGGVVVISRRHTPGWAIALAIIGFFLFLLGLLFLLVKKTENLSVSVSPRGEDESTVVIAGEASDYLRSAVQSTLTPPLRKCSTCGSSMSRSASVCPRCGETSAPWIFHAGVWWMKGVTSGEWQWVDEDELIWRYYKNGTPSDPSATDRTAKFTFNPTLVRPPEESKASVAEPSHRESLTTELEHLAALHDRGALTNEEFVAAKERLLRETTGE